MHTLFSSRGEGRSRIGMNTEVKSKCWGDGDESEAKVIRI